MQETWSKAKMKKQDELQEASLAKKPSHVAVEDVKLSLLKNDRLQAQIDEGEVEDSCDVSDSMEADKES